MVIIETKRYVATRRGLQDGTEKYLSSLVKIFQLNFELSDNNNILTKYDENTDWTLYFRNNILIGYEKGKSNNDHNTINLHTDIYKDGEYVILANYYSHNKGLLLIDVISPNNKIKDYFEPQKNKGFIDVSDNPIYTDSSIIKGSIPSKRIVLEGSKGVGKQAIIDQLINIGVICQDRDLACVSNEDVFALPLKERCRAYYHRMNEDENEYFLFLSNTNVAELKRRINTRTKIDTSKEDDFRFPQEYYAFAYKEAFEYMKKHKLLNNKLYLIDCENLTYEEQIQVALNTVSSIFSKDNDKQKELDIRVHFN